MFAGNTIPAGWLLCDGSAVSRTDYAKLFSAIGTIYGEGDGNTTFTLPNLIDRVVQGAATAGTYKEAGLPNIEGSFPCDDTAINGTIEGACYVKSGRYVGGINAGGGAGYSACQIGIDASKSNPIYGNSTTVQPPALTMLPLIKY